MKKQIDFSLIAILVGAIIFNFIFWNEGIGINFLLYSSFIIITLWKSCENATREFRFSTLAHFFSALMVVYNGSALAMVAWVFSLLVMIGFSHTPVIKSIFFAIVAAVIQGMVMPASLLGRLGTIKIGGVSLRPIVRKLKYVILPMILVVIFGSIYSGANQVFGEFMESFFTKIGNFLEETFAFFFAEISFGRVIFFFFGLAITSALLLHYKNELLRKIEGSFVEKLIRKRKSKKPRNDFQLFEAKPKMIGLKTESIIGIISFTGLNLLLLFLNGIDIFSLWFGNTESNLTLSVELHDGTNALIFSIVIAMLVILFFFRGNLNFYQKNKTIKRLAYLWIVQNTFLVASVFLKDYHYILALGLTYKRIGVLVFLLLCLIGLATVYFKVKHQKTLFYLVKTNGLIWYILLLFFTIFNWDVIIIRYNIVHQSSIAADLKQINGMSDKIIPLLVENEQSIKSNLKQRWFDPVQRRIWTKEEAIDVFDRKLEQKISRFKADWEATSWLSWNYRDWQTHRFIEQHTTYNQY